MIVYVCREIIHPAGYIDELAITEALTHFFDRTMDVPQMRLYFFNCFSVERNNKVKYTMRSRVLRANIDDHVTCPPTPRRGDYRVVYYVGLSIQNIFKLVGLVRNQAPPSEGLPAGEAGFGEAFYNFIIFTGSSKSFLNGLFPSQPSGKISNRRSGWFKKITPNIS